MGGSLDSLAIPAVKVTDRGQILAVSAAAADALASGGADLVGQDWEEVSRRLAEPAAAVILQSGETLYLLGQHEVTRRLQEQIYHLSRLASVGQLVSTVVHEINNALSGIVGYSQLLLARSLEDSVALDAQKVYEEALRTSKVVQNLLQFSRSGRGDRKPVPLVELLERAAEMKRRDFVLKSIEFEFRCRGRIPLVQGDEALLFQVLVNLLTNAEQSIHSLGNPGRIAVLLRTSRGRVLVDVRDDGPGVDPAQRERIFEPFVSHREGQGTGLGLPLCRQILHEHGGDIRLHDAGPPGACFRLRIPVTACLSAPRTGAVMKTPERRICSRRVVVVEDEASLRELVARAFAGNGNRIVTFESGEDALPYLLQEPVDLVLTDIHRPGLDGIGLFRRLQRDRPELARRVLFMTGDTTREETTAFLRRARAPVLHKPILLEELQRAAVKLLDQPSAQGELFAS